jgi:hypothetical protein
MVKYWESSNMALRSTTIDNPLLVYIPCLLTLVLALPGCSESGPPLGTVSGTVTLDGRPLEGAAIVFSPKAQAVDAGSSSGKTGQDGKYALEFGSSRKGAYLGEHSVIIEHKSYFKADHPATVKEGKNSIDFTLTSNKKNKNRDAVDNAQDLPAAK